jgi:hypothetical protein
MKNIIRLIVFISFFFTSMIAYGQTGYPLQVSLVPKSSFFPPYAGEYIEDPFKFFNVIINNTSQMSYNIYVAVKLEMVSPPDFSVSTPPMNPPPNPLMLGSFQSINMLPNQWRDMLSHIGMNDLITSGVNIVNFSSGGFLLPEGLYKACAIVYNFDKPGEALSNPAFSCAMFNICYKAKAPQIAAPATCLANGIQQLNPSNPVFLAWIPPIFNCTAPIFEYDVRIVELMDGQDPQTAIEFNPVVYKEEGLRVTSKIIDTIQNPLTFIPGRTYTLRVTAKNPDPTRLIMLENDGHSPICSFKFGSTPIPPVVPELPADDPTFDIPPVVNDTTPSTIADCIFDSDNISKEFFATNLSNKRITIGHFIVFVQQASETGGVYRGNGYVHWKPYINDTIRIKVEFDNIKVNNKLQVYQGEIYTVGTDLIDYVPRDLQKVKDWANGRLTYFEQHTGANLPTFRQKMNGYYNLLREPSRKLNQISGGAPILLPLTIASEIPNMPIDIGIVGMCFTPNSAKMNTMAVFEVPESVPSESPWLAFVGQGMCFTPNNLMLVDEGALFLAADFNVKLTSTMDLNFKRATNLGNVADGTFIKWDSKGYKEARIDCEMQLPLNWVLPEDNVGNIIVGQRVKAKFSTHLISWNNWIASATMDPFQLTGVSGFGFLPEQIFYDNSSTLNPPDIKFPKGYPSTGVGWKGFYIKQLSMRLPPDFKRFDQPNARTQTGISDLILDRNGVSCDVFARNLIALSTGNLGGWAFSLDTVNIKIKENNFNAGWIAGRLRLPISDTTLIYRGTILTTTNDINFTVKPRNNMEMGAWLAKIVVDQSSRFELKKDNQGIAISFLLNGSMTMGDLVSTSDVKFSMAEVGFQNFGISNRNPSTGLEDFYLDIGTWALASDQKTLGPFPVNFRKPVLLKETTASGTSLIGIQFPSDFSIMEKFRCDTKINVLGKIVWQRNIAPPKITYNDIRLDEIEINGDFSVVKVNGKLKFYYDHATYGDGVKGQVTATFEPLITLQATAQFGKKSDFTYWYVDALATFTEPFETPPLAISGFGGGVYYNMRQENVKSKPEQQYSTTRPHNIDNLNPDESVSGIRYVPQKNHHGMKAGLSMALSKTVGGPHILNTTAWIECGFNDTGVTNFVIKGQAFAITQYPDTTNALAKGIFEMGYNFSTSVFYFDVDLQAKLNLGLNTQSITIPLEFWCNTSTAKWYFKLGDPHPPGKLMKAQIVKINAGPLKAELNAQAYIAFGNALDNTAMPAVPDQIIQFLQPIDLSKYRANPSVQVGPKKGMLFGASIDGSLDLDLILYCHLTAIAGFDVAMYHNPNEICNNKPVGYQGWYGNGQIYGYFDGDIGIKINVWFFKGKASLARLTAGALLIGGVPKPMWAYGKVKVKGSVLGGLIKISTSLEMEVGEICYISGGNPLADVRIIEEIKPGYSTLNEAKQYEPESIFLSPTITSNVDLSNNIALKPINLVQPPTTKGGDTTYRTFIFYIDTIWWHKGSSTYVGQNSTKVAMKFNVSSSKPTLVTTELRDYEEFEPNKLYMLRVIATAKEFYPNLNRYDYPTIDGVKKRYVEPENKSFFRTGDRPDNIPKENIVFSRPLHMQRYHFKNDEYKIRLSQQQNYIFTDPNKRFEASIATTWENYAFPYSQNKVAFTYGQSISFFPNKSSISGNTVYVLTLIRIDKAKEQEFLKRMAVEKRRQVIKNLLLNEANVVISIAGATGASGIQVIPKTGLPEGTTPMVGNPNYIAGIIGNSIGSGVTTSIVSAGSGTTFNTGNTLVIVPAQPKIKPNINIGGTNINLTPTELWEEALKEHNIKYKADTIDYRQMALEGRWNLDFIDTLISINFGTSRFGSLKEKIESFGALQTKREPYRISVAASEPFEYIDIYGYDASLAQTYGYRSAIPPLIKFQEIYNQTLYNDDLIWKRDFFEKIHWMSDECIKTAFKPRPRLATVQNPEGIYCWLSIFTQNSDRKEKAYPLAPNARQPENHFPNQSIRMYHDGNVSGNSFILHHRDVAAPLSNNEIRQLKPDYNPIKLRYDYKRLRLNIESDLLNIESFQRDFKKVVETWEKLTNGDKDRTGKIWIDQKRYVGSSKINYPIYQFIKWHHDDFAIYRYFKQVSYSLPNRNYTFRHLHAYHLDASNPMNSSGLPNYKQNSSAIIQVFY